MGFRHLNFNLLLLERKETTMNLNHAPVGGVRFTRGFLKVFPKTKQNNH